MTVHSVGWALPLPVGRRGSHISLLIVLVFAIFTSQGVDHDETDAGSQSPATLTVVSPLSPQKSDSEEVHLRAERSTHAEPPYSPYAPGGPVSPGYLGDSDYGGYNWDYLVPDYAKWWWPKYPPPKSYQPAPPPPPVQSGSYGSTGRSDVDGLDFDEDDGFFADAPEVFEDDGTSLDGLNDVASDGFVPQRKKMIMDPAFPSRGGWWVWHWKMTPLCTRCWRVCRHVLLPTEKVPGKKGKKDKCEENEDDPDCNDGNGDKTDGDGSDGAEDGGDESADHPLVMGGAGMVMGGHTGAARWDPNTSSRVALACSPCIPRCRTKEWHPGFQPPPGWSRIKYVRPWDKQGRLRTHVRIPRPARVLRGGHPHSRIPFAHRGLPHRTPFGVRPGGGGGMMMGRPHRPHGGHRGGFGRRRADEDFFEDDV